MNHFCAGKYSSKILKKAQYAYNEGLRGAVASDSTIAGYKQEIKLLFDGKLKIT